MGTLGSRVLSDFLAEVPCPISVRRLSVQGPGSRRTPHLLGERSANACRGGEG